MADGRDPASGFSYRNALPWTEIFRCFQVALDPRKLLVAAVGILVMSFGWYVLSASFYYPAPSRDADEYSNSKLERELRDKKKPGTDTPYSEDDRRAIGDQRYQADVEQWQVLAELAGPGGSLRTLPWYENRGPNPYLFLTQLTNLPSSLWGDAVYTYLKGQIPVLTEPLVKLLMPVLKLVSPGVSPQTRLYLLLVILWMVAVWAFCGGVITRLAAVQLANKGPITLKQACQFVAKRYLSFLLAPVVPLIIIGVVVFGLMCYGLLGMIPFLGDIVFLGLGLPIIIAAGAVMAVFLVGLVGYPLMYTTLSVEGDSSDTFDALSRSINYVYQAPWHYIWYSLVAVVYGAAVTFFVLFFASLMVYLGKWAVSQTPGNESADRKPDFLFIYTPESFGWRELLLKDSPYAVEREVVPQYKTWAAPANPKDAIPTNRMVVVYRPISQQQYDQNRNEFWWYNTWGAGIVCFWLTLMFLMMVGFSYSFFWSAATVIYLLMRKKVDEADIDEVFVEEDEPEAPMPPPKSESPTSLPVIVSPTAPAAPPVPPVAVVPPPPPPATIPFSPPPPPPVVPPVVPPPVTPPEATKPETPKPDTDEPKTP